MVNPGVPCLVQSQDPRPSMGRWWEKSIPLIKQPNRWPAELAEPPGDGWTPPRRHRPRRVLPALPLGWHRWQAQATK